MASAISFQGLSTNLQTDQLVNAIIAQESVPMQTLQARQTLNTQRSSVLQTINSDILAFSTSLSALSTTAIQSQAVTSSDANGTYASATASGASVGSYDLTVSQVATRAKLDNASFALKDATTAKVFDDTKATSATFAVQGTDGAVTTITLDSAHNNLNGLRDAINTAEASLVSANSTSGVASTPGVTATIMNTGLGDSPYRLVLAANDTGTGTTEGALTLADITAGGAVNNLGIGAGSLNDPNTPTKIIGGTVSTGSQVAVDANFSLNGIDMSRQSNVVTDAADGLTLTLKKGDNTNTVTTFSVAVNQSAIASAANDVVSKFNAIVNDYATNSGSGGALANDTTISPLIRMLRSAFTGVPTGVSINNAYNSAPAMGFKTNQDGTLSLDTTALQSAVTNNLSQVQAVLKGSYTAASTLVNGITSPGSGNIALVLSSITQQNFDLAHQITTMQERLDAHKTQLQDQYAQMEAVVGQLQAAGQSLSGIK